MSDEENMSVQEAIPEAPQATESENQAATAESQEAARKRNDQEYNWAEARRKLKELERQNYEMASQLQSMQQPKTQEIDDLDKLADDEIMTKAQVKKLTERMARQMANEAIKQREASTVDERLTNKFSDFADVVTKENIELLKQNEPELANSLYHNPDPFAQGVAAYKLIKKLGIQPDMTKSIDRKKAEANSQKPVSVNAVSKNSAIGNAHLFENGLTADLKKQLWKEMEDARKRM